MIMISLLKNACQDFRSYLTSLYTMHKRCLGVFFPIKNHLELRSHNFVTQRLQRDRAIVDSRFDVFMYTHLFPRISCSLRMVSSSSMLNFPLLISGLKQFIQRSLQLLPHLNKPKQFIYISSSYIRKFTCLCFSFYKITVIQTWLAYIYINLICCLIVACLVNKFQLQLMI